MEESRKRHLQKYSGFLVFWVPVNQLPAVSQERRDPGKELKMPFESESLTSLIIGAAIEVHRQLGPGFLESVYENALVIELRKRGLKTEQQKTIHINYDGIQIGEHRLDLLVEDTVIVELKTVHKVEDIHFAIVKSYLRASGLHDGLILNFAKMTLEIKHVFSSSTAAAPD